MSRTKTFGTHLSPIDRENFFRWIANSCVHLRDQSYGERRNLVRYWIDCFKNK